MNDGTICPRCRGPTIFESKSCRSFLNHIRACNIDKSDCQSSLLTKSQECPFTCPICKSPTIYKSNTCQSFLNHARVCGIIELKKTFLPRLSYLMMRNSSYPVIGLMLMRELHFFNLDDKLTNGLLMPTFTQANNLIMNIHSVLTMILTLTKIA